MKPRARLLAGISVFWFGLSMLFDGLNALVIPDQLLEFTGERHKATLLGLITFIGIAIGMLVQPVAGAISDRLRIRRGRRDVIVVGAAVILLALVLLDTAWGLAALIGAYILVQFGAGIAQAAQQGFIPDVVPSEQRGIASGLKGLMDLMGAMLGFVVLGALLSDGGTRSALVAIAAVVLFTLVITVVLVRERPLQVPAPVRRLSLPEIFRVDLQRHRFFAILVGSRFLFLLGTYAVGRFFLYYVTDRLGLDPDRAPEQAGVILGALALTTGVAAVPAGWAADRVGRIPIMVAGALVSAFGVILLIPASSNMAILLGGVLMALGSAGFAAANWAFTADLVPANEAARFMGIANFGTAGAAAATGLFGPLMDASEYVVDGAGYPVLFAAASVAMISSALVLKLVNTEQVRQGQPGLVGD